MLNDLLESVNCAAVDRWASARACSRSPALNGIAESFVNTFRRDYVSRMDLSDAATVLAQLPAAFEHFNEVHPHSSLKMRSPREFRRQRSQALTNG